VRVTIWVITRGSSPPAARANATSSPQAAASPAQAAGLRSTPDRPSGYRRFFNVILRVTDRLALPAVSWPLSLRTAEAPRFRRNSALPFLFRLILSLAFPGSVVAAFPEPIRTDFLRALEFALEDETTYTSALQTPASLAWNANVKAFLRT
jgi:hypothetical protein